MSIKTKLGIAIFCGIFCLVVFLAGNALQTKADETPVITSISPTSGQVGTEVTISGSGFGDNCGSSNWCVMSVDFGGKVVTNTSFENFVSWSDTQIVVKVPQGATTALIKISYYYDTNGLDEGGVVKYYSSVEGPTFTVLGVEPRAIDSISPARAVVGTEVTILGHGFEESCGSGMYCNMMVDFGQGRSSNANFGIVSWTDKKIVAKVPDDATTASIKVSYYYDSNGPDEGGDIIQYQITGPIFTLIETPSAEPVITSISPTSGPVGTEVTINGTNFGSDCGSGHWCSYGVNFGQGYANNLFDNIISWSMTKIVVKVPQGATTAPIVIGMYYDTNGPDEGGVVAQYSVTGPAFTVTKTNENTNEGPEIIIQPEAGQVVSNAYGCFFSTSLSNSTTIKVNKLFNSGDSTDTYLKQVYEAYKNAWNRYPRCDELQFHLDHSTPTERLKSWLNQMLVLGKIEDKTKSADIQLTENNNEIALKETGLTLKFAENQDIIISGLATPNSVVIIRLSSQPKAYITISDNEGYWTYTAKSLENGQHTLAIAVYDQTGKEVSQSDNLAFSISSSKTTESKTNEKMSLGIFLAVVIIALVLILFAVILTKRRKTR